MAEAFRMDQPRVRAVLGPTNTGKTHLAIDRMLAHASGIIGFPLRLLARENYERMVARKGPAQVALITGEEKIVPPNARYFSCTVEAMPLDRPVEFLAIDEIQLCADPDRGHIFTDRLLNARGLAETMLLGADTIRPLLRRLVPQVEIDSRPRLSSLTHAGDTRLSRLPPRSAVVAFSATEVYAIAEAIRRRRGGCAIVMGRLSPRTRNAQVALFQDKEVDFLVATDAIGMGLNMDVNHVAFAGLSKFDGHRPRPLDAAEIAQIGGRAGRGMRDGTFGSTADAGVIPPDLVEQVENHRFDPLTTLRWRNAALDFTTTEGLLGSLAAPPPLPILQKSPDALDHLTLAVLARDPEIRRLADRPARLRLLWQACQIPDFRKLSDETHTRLCEKVFCHLVSPPHRLPPDWLARNLAELDRPDGDIDTLMARLAGVRIWAYIAARPDWLNDAPAWQARAREIEDRLSDALHQRLTARFVDRRAAHLIRQLEADGEALLSAVARSGEVVVEGHTVGRIAGLTFKPVSDSHGDPRRTVMRAARRALAAEMPLRVARLEAAPDPEFTLDATHRVLWHPDSEDASPVGRLRRGASAMRPQVEPLSCELLDGTQRDRVRRRLAAWVAARISAELAPVLRLAELATKAPDLRALANQLAEGLGIAAAPSQPLAAAARLVLRRHGVVAGRRATYLPALLKPRPAALRATLLALMAGEPSSYPQPPSGAISIDAEGFQPGWPWTTESALHHGWVAAGPILIRLDVAERVGAALLAATRSGPLPVTPDLASRLGCKVAALPAVLRGLGFRIRPGESGALLYRPARGRSQAPAAVAKAAAPVNPAFAALATLRR
jgi:ATP-dependent RNA helicase SUPV3L1/SUV3